MTGQLGSYDEPVRAAAMPIWEAAIAAARQVARDDETRFRDEGTCVLGAGIAIYFLPPRCRYPRRRVLIDAPFQGNVGSRLACERALAVLRGLGLAGAHWYDGRMD